MEISTYNRRTGTTYAVDARLPYYEIHYQCGSKCPVWKDRERLSFKSKFLASPYKRYKKKRYNYLLDGDISEFMEQGDRWCQHCGNHSADSEGCKTVHAVSSLIIGSREMIRHLVMKNRRMIKTAKSDPKRDVHRTVALSLNPQKRNNRLKQMDRLSTCPYHPKQKISKCGKQCHFKTGFAFDSYKEVFDQLAEDCPDMYVLGVVESGGSSLYNDNVVNLPGGKADYLMSENRWEAGLETMVRELMEEAMILLTPEMYETDTDRFETVIGLPSVTTTGSKYGTTDGHHLHCLMLDEKDAYSMTLVSKSDPSTVSYQIEYKKDGGKKKNKNKAC